MMGRSGDCSWQVGEEGEPIANGQSYPFPVFSDRHTPVLQSTARGPGGRRGKVVGDARTRLGPETFREQDPLAFLGRGGAPGGPG